MTLLSIVVATVLTNFREPLFTQYDTANQFVLEESHTLYTSNTEVLDFVSNSVTWMQEDNSYRLIHKEPELSIDSIVANDSVLTLTVTPNESTYSESLPINPADIVTEEISTSKYLLDYVQSHEDIYRNYRVTSTGETFYITDTESFIIEPTFTDADKYILHVIIQENHVTLVYEILYSEDSSIFKEEYRYTVNFNKVPGDIAPLLLLQTLFTNP